MKMLTDKNLYDKLTEGRQPHASLVLVMYEPEENFKSLPGVGVIAKSTSGCLNCLALAIALQMVKDENFRALVNKAGKIANAVRGGAGVEQFANPQHN